MSNKIISAWQGSIGYFLIGLTSSPDAVKTHQITVWGAMAVGETLETLMATIAASLSCPHSAWALVAMVAEGVRRPAPVRRYWGLHQLQIGRLYFMV